MREKRLFYLEQLQIAKFPFLELHRCVLLHEIDNGHIQQTQLLRSASVERSLLLDDREEYIIIAAIAH